jgi:hypothetical protein
VGPRTALRIITTSVAVALLSLMAPAAAHAEQVGDCRLNLDWPHASGHFPGRASSNAVIKCNNPHGILRVKATLYHYPPPPKSDGWFPAPYSVQIKFFESDPVEVRDASYASAAAFTEECVNGEEYRATAEFDIVDGDTTEHREHNTAKRVLSGWP